MLVSVVIINYNTFELTCNCIRSIYEHTKHVDYEVVLVDNASTKNDPDDFLRLFPNITLVKSKENGGFAKGNNLGIEQSKGEVILLLNSDTYLIEDSISKTTQYLQQHPDLIISPRLVYEDRIYQKSARKFRSIGNELMNMIRPLLFLLPYKRRAQLMLNQYFNGDFDTRCDWVSGAYMTFYKKHLDLFPQKKLDERFFMYGEDHLWCYQFLEHGIKSFFLSSTTVVHISNASTDKVKQLKILKTAREHELEIMAYRKGKGLYYYIFKTIYTTKEQIRYNIANVVLRLFNKRIR